ncbi:MAG: HAMP domain-containing histidine kinase [Planctomycetes bacterium]|nr:HAMP domain-containing histidine kinase [Planctomycetota bacterium]
MASGRLVAGSFIVPDCDRGTRTFRHRVARGHILQSALANSADLHWCSSCAVEKLSRSRRWLANCTNRALLPPVACGRHVSCGCGLRALMLSDVTIAKKTLAVVAVPVLMNFGLVVVLGQLGSASDEMVRGQHQSQALMLAAERIESGLVSILQEITDQSSPGLGPNVVEIEQNRVDVVAALAEAREMAFADPEVGGILAELLPKSEALLGSLIATLDESRDAGAAGQTINLRSAADNRELDAIQQLITRVGTSQQRIGTERLAGIAELAADRRLVLMLGAVLVALYAVVSGLLVARGIVGRLRVVGENVDRMGQDRELLAPIGGLDEIGDIDRAFHEMNRVLGSQRRENDMFVYSVSHDLRSPLVNLQGFGSELVHSMATMRRMLDDPRVPEDIATRLRELADGEVQEALDYIALAVQRQSNIIDSLLRLSRAGRVEYTWDVVSTHECLESVARGVRSRSGPDADVEITVDPLPDVLGDRTAIERVFDNLLSNAVKYRSPDRPCRIHVGAEEADAERVTFFVRDNSVGIAPHQLERVFLPFARLDDRPGEGIGLTIVRKIVERLQGRVWIESTVGVGSTIRVTLCLARRGSTERTPVSGGAA